MNTIVKEQEDQKTQFMQGNLEQPATYQYQQPQVYAPIDQNQQYQQQQFKQQPVVAYIQMVPQQIPQQKTDVLYVADQQQSLQPIYLAPQQNFQGQIVQQPVGYGYPPQQNVVYTVPIQQQQFQQQNGVPIQYPPQQVIYQAQPQNKMDSPINPSLMKEQTSSTTQPASFQPNFNQEEGSTSQDNNSTESTSRELQKNHDDDEDSAQEEDQQLYNITVHSPDRLNKWMLFFLKYDKIRQLFPVEMQDGKNEQTFADIFRLKNVDNKLNIKIHFQTKEEYQKKAIVLKEKKRSKFHNKNKLFFNSIIKIFKKKNLQKLNIPDKLFDAFYNFVESCRNTGRRYKNNKVAKTDLFNHSHYVLLFLTLNKQTIQQIQNDKNYLKIHQDVTGFDLTQPISEEDLQFINFMKICTYQVLAFHMREIMIGTREQQCEEREYDFRAFQGILEMIKGRHRDRF